MSLKPRHFVLLAVILGLFAYNIYSRRRAAMPTDSPAPVVTTTQPLPAQTPAWTAFDHAASLRDVPIAQFDPAMQSLQQQLDATHDATASDIKGCLTWLQYYRQGVNHPPTSGKPDPQWKDRSERHLDGCVKYHLDTSL